MQNGNFDNLIRGFDTIQCCYFMKCAEEAGIDFQSLQIKKEQIQRLKRKDPVLVSIGKYEFLLHPFGSSSGYPLIISNEDFRIEMGEFNDPNFFVTFRSETALAKHRVYTLWFSLNVNYIRHGPGVFQVASKTLPAARFFRDRPEERSIGCRSSPEIGPLTNASTFMN